jgi:hypothetical protein
MPGGLCRLAVLITWTAVDSGSLLSVYRVDRTADRSVKGSTRYTVYCWYRIFCAYLEGICHIYVTTSTCLTTGGRHGGFIFAWQKKVCTERLTELTLCCKQWQLGAIYCCCKMRNLWCICARTTFWVVHVCLKFITLVRYVCYISLELD